MHCFSYNKNEETGEVYVFSALDTAATRKDFDNAETDGKITANWKAALIANLYTAAQDAPNPSYWALL